MSLYKSKIVYSISDGSSFEFSYDNGILLKEFEGFTGTDVDVETSQSVTQVGGSLLSQTVNPLSIKISGVIMKESQSIKSQILSTCRILDKATLTVNDQYSINAYITTAPYFQNKDRWAEFQIFLLAPYPFWESTVTASTSLSGLVNGFSFPWNISETYNFSTQLTSFFTNVFNAGQVDNFFTIEIVANGPCENPIFSNTNTGEFLKLNIEIVESEIITISITNDNISATSSINGDIEGLLDIDNTLYFLRVGDNIIKYDADSGRDNLNIFIKQKYKYSGVVV